MRDFLDFFTKMEGRREKVRIERENKNEREKERKLIHLHMLSFIFLYLRTNSESSGKIFVAKNLVTHLLEEQNFLKTLIFSFFLFFFFLSSQELRIFGKRLD